MSEQFNADLDIIQAAPIELELLDGNLNVIQQLDDEPNDVGGLTSAELKAKFDQAGNTIKQYINETLIPAILASDATEVARINAETARTQAEAARNTWEIWDSGKPYLPLQKVSRQGSSYICTVACTGIDPAADVAGSGEGSHWLLIAAKGDQGPQGERGIQGEQGIQGIQGNIGPVGPGVPAGGTQGQVLRKASAADHDTEWADAESFDQIFKSLNVGDVYHSYRDDIYALSNYKLIPMDGRSINISSSYYDIFKSIPKLNVRLNQLSQISVHGNWGIAKGTIWRIDGKYVWPSSPVGRDFYTSDLTASSPPELHSLNDLSADFSDAFASENYLMVPTVYETTLSIEVYDEVGNRLRTKTITHGVAGGSLSCFGISDGYIAIVFVASDSDTGQVVGFASDDGFNTYTQVTFGGATSVVGKPMQFITAQEPNLRKAQVLDYSFYIGFVNGNTFSFYKREESEDTKNIDFSLTVQMQWNDATYPGYGCICPDGLPAIFINYGVDDIWFERFVSASSSVNTAVKGNVINPSGTYQIAGGAYTDHSSDKMQEDFLWFYSDGTCERFRVENLAIMNSSFVTFTSEKGDWKPDLLNRDVSGGILQLDERGDLWLLPNQKAIPSYEPEATAETEGGLLVLDLKAYSYVYITNPLPTTETATAPAALSMGIVRSSYAGPLRIVTGYRNPETGDTYDNKVFSLPFTYRKIPEADNSYLKIRE